MQGLKSSEAVARRRTIDIDEQSITGQFKALDAGDGIVVNEAVNLPDDRRNRTERRRTRNPVFEARARRVGMALDRRQHRGWLAALRGRGKMVLRALFRLPSDREHTLDVVSDTSASTVTPQGASHSSSISSSMAAQPTRAGT